MLAVCPYGVVSGYRQLYVCTFFRELGRYLSYSTAMRFVYCATRVAANTVKRA
jgi:hypothetical protein